MMIRGQKIVGWQDFIELTLSCWIFLSPFVLGFIGDSTAAMVAILFGSVAVMFSLLGLSTQMMGDEWGNILTAFFLFISPWVFGYTHVEIAVMNAMACGVLLAFLSLLTLMEEKAELRKEQEKGMSH